MTISIKSAMTALIAALVLAFAFSAAGIVASAHAGSSKTAGPFYSQHQSSGMSCDEAHWSIHQAFGTSGGGYCQLQAGNNNGQYVFGYDSKYVYTVTKKQSKCPLSCRWDTTVVRKS